MLRWNLIQTFDNSKELHFLMETCLFMPLAGKEASLDNANTVCLKFILFFMISFEKKKKSYLPAKFENALFFDDGKV